MSPAISICPSVTDIQAELTISLHPSGSTSSIPSPDPQERPGGLYQSTKVLACQLKDGGRPSKDVTSCHVQSPR